jgi:hypothetical protein
MLILQINVQGASSVISLKENNVCLGSIYQFYILHYNAMSKYDR